MDKRAVKYNRLSRNRPKHNCIFLQILFIYLFAYLSILIFTGVHSIYNVLISAVQESDSGVHIHPFLDPFLIYIITEYQGEFPLLNAIE